MFLGPVPGEKPPLAPKPKFIPLPKTVSQPLNLDHSQPPINTVQSACVSQQCLSKPLTPEWKPVAVFTSEYQSHFQQQLDNVQGLLHSQLKSKSEINSGQPSATTPYKVREFSGDQLMPLRVIYGQSYGTVKNNLNLANGSGGSERNSTNIPRAAQIFSPTGLQPKSAESKRVLLNSTQHRHSADEQNGHSTSIPFPVQKASPILGQNKPKSSHVEQPEKPDLTSQESGGFVKPQYKALTVKESTLAVVYKEGRTVSPRKHTRNERQSSSKPETQNDDVELLGNYPCWKVHSSEQKTGQDVPNNRTESTSGKKSAITLKHKVKSLTQADLNQSNGQRKSSFKKLMDFEFSVKKLPKLFSKGGQGPETTAGKDEQSVDESRQASRDQIPQYRTHHVNVQQDERTAEHSVDGNSVENEQLYEDILENINIYVPKSPRIQTQQNPTIWQRYLTTKEERKNGKTQVLEELNTTVSQDHNER